MSSLPTRPPRRTDETGPFWDACAQERLVLPKCTECAELIWYPRRFCPSCGSRAVEWVEVSGAGVVYTYTIIRRGSGPFRDAAPYVVAMVELAEGPRLLTNIVTEAPDTVRCGQAVRVVFDAAGDDKIPRFEVVATPPA